MATRKPKLSDRESQARLSRLEQLGISMRPVADPSPEPERIIVEQTDYHFARLHELLSGEIALVVPVQITVLTPGILIIEQELTTSLDDFPLEFADPTEWKYYEDVIADCPSRENLNYLLMNPRPLRPRKELGVIVASGWNKIPPQFHDDTSLKAQLLLIDERRNEIYAEFVVRLDRSLKRRYERIQAERRERVRSTVGGRPPASEAEPRRDQKNVAQRESINPRKDSNGAIHKPQQPN